MRYGRSPRAGCCGCRRQLLLQAPDLLEAAGYVPHDGDDAIHMPLRVLERHDRELQRDALPALADARHRQEVAVAVVARTGRYDIAEPLPMRCTEALRDDEVQRLPERLVGMMAEDPHGSRVHTWMIPSRSVAITASATAERMA